LSTVHALGHCRPVARIRLFRSVRYDPDRVSPARALAPPYDIVSPAEREALGEEPYNVVHLELPLDEEGPGSRYEVAARRLSDWLASGVLRRDREPALYAYAQSFDHQGRARERRGFLGVVELVPPGGSSGVFPHELTLAGPREDRLRLLRATRANLSPVFLLYEDPSGLAEEAIDGALRSRPRTEARTPWGTEETMAPLPLRSAGEIAERLSRVPLVFADGHHRYESALRYHEEQKGKNIPEDRTADPAHAYALAVFVERSDPGLLVLPTHRIVRSIAGSEEAWSAAVAACFDIERFDARDGAERALGWLGRQGKVGRTAFVCVKAGEDELLGLVLRPEGRERLFQGREIPALLRELDVVVLHALLEAGLGITAAAVGEQGALAYTRDAAEALAAVRHGAAAAFVLNPTPVESVVRVASAGHRLPQKTTYFHPKLTSGWAFHVHDRPAEIWEPARGEGTMGESSEAGAAGPGRMG
jgi:uncharacterized protein (DUF1015 family)